MKTTFVVAGRAPGWVRNQTRIAAETLTEDGRVLIAMSDAVDSLDLLPGSTGHSTLLGVARTGYPLWTGRLSSVIGLRRRSDRTVIVRFDGDRHLLLAVSALISRARRERLVVHDARVKPTQGVLRRFTARLVDALADAKVTLSASTTVGGPSIALAVCHDDTELARLAIRAAQAMSEATAKSWRIVIQADDPAVERMIAETDRRDILVYEPAGPVEDLVKSSDVVVVRDGSDPLVTRCALDHGAAVVSVGHPVGGRVTPRFDGAWLVRHDPSSIIVAIENVRMARFGGPAAIDVRTDGLRLADTLRSLELAAA